MSKNYYFITNEATKYWKKEIKSGRLQIANHNGFYYILNGYNAFKIPAWPMVWADLIQPAAMLAPPEDGAAYIWCNGIFQKGTGAQTVDIVEKALEPIRNPATRSPFTYDTKGETCRLYKLQNGQTAGINAKYDAMVDHTQRHEIRMDSAVNPAILTCGEDECKFTALLCPMRCPNLTEDMERLNA